jgi:AcrR family transcriptional regulator
MVSASGCRRLRRDAQENLERVLEHAASVFAERGLGVTLADIARAARVGVGTLYRRFPDKDELILAVYQEKMQGAMRKAKRAGADADPWQGLQGMKQRPDTTFGTMNDDVIAHLDPSFRRADFAGIIRTSAWPE